MNAKIKVETLNKVLQYLGTKPFIEVVELIEEIKKAEILKEDNNNGKE